MHGNVKAVIPVVQPRSCFYSSFYKQSQLSPIAFSSVFKRLVWPDWVVSMIFRFYELCESEILNISAYVIFHESFTLRVFFLNVMVWHYCHSLSEQHWHTLHSNTHTTRKSTFKSNKSASVFHIHRRSAFSPVWWNLSYLFCVFSDKNKHLRTAEVSPSEQEEQEEQRRL